MTSVGQVIETGKPEFGDYQCNSAMSLAPVIKRKPRDIAESLIKQAELHESIEKLDVAGPGFINIYLKSDWLISRLLDMTKDHNLLVPEKGRGRTVVIDYSSPNVAKPMHIGHIRSTIIGNSLYRMYKFLGYHAVSDNHMGDWGTQFGILIMGYRNFLDKKALEENPIDELERIYVKSYEESRANEEWLSKCRNELVKLQNGDKENLKLWKLFVDLSIKEFDRIYDRLGITFDFIRGESFYNDRLGSVIEDLKEKKLLSRSEGADVVFLDDEKLPVCIVKKSDGAYNYATTDIATVITRVKEFDPERIIYVTDERQQLHFRQIFAICRKLQYNVNLVHVWFGLMRLPDVTFSTREGNVIKLERLLDEAESRALEIVNKTNPAMPDDVKKEVARAVGIGAVKYADLSQNPQTTVTFTWDKALALDGNSGPYLQYACARISSVLDKYSEKFPDSDLKEKKIFFSDPIERELAVKLLKFPDVIIRAAENYRPSTLADYLYELTQIYNNFYQNVPFLKAEEGIRESRVKLCSIVVAVLKKGLELLGIETPERI